MENPIKMDDLGGFPPIFGNTHIIKCYKIFPTQIQQMELYFFVPKKIGETWWNIQGSFLGLPASKTKRIDGTGVDDMGRESMIWDGSRLVGEIREIR